MKLRKLYAIDLLVTVEYSNLIIAMSNDYSLTIQCIYCYYSYYL